MEKQMDMAKRPDKCSAELDDTEKGDRLRKLYVRYQDDMVFRGQMSLYMGQAISFVYAVFKLISSWIYASVWVGAVAVYYIVLCALRIGLIRAEKRAEHLPDIHAQEMQRLKSYRRCGVSIFVLNVGMVGMIIQMIRDNRCNEYPGHLIYAMAAYTFYALAMAVIDLMKYHKVKHPIIQASKVITLCTALMSLFSLQAALIAQFGGEGERFRQLMNSITGTAVCLLTIAAAVTMIVWSTQQLHRKKSTMEL